MNVDNHFRTVGRLVSGHRVDRFQLAYTGINLTFFFDMRFSRFCADFNRTFLTIECFIHIDTAEAYQALVAGETIRAELAEAGFSAH